MGGYFQEEESADKRKERRWNIPITVRVKGRGADGKEFEEETITTDASPSGMCVLVTAAMQKGEQVTILAPEEGFESTANVRKVNPLGAGMNRVRVQFPKGVRFSRASAAKKYVYDYALENWVGYIHEGNYYNTKHEVFGKVEGNNIVSTDSGATLFRIKTDRVYDLRGNCIGHLI